MLSASHTRIAHTQPRSYVCPTIGRKWGIAGTSGRASANCECAYCDKFAHLLRGALMERKVNDIACGGYRRALLTHVLQMFTWAEQFQSAGKTIGRSQMSLVVALFDESENMYLSNGRSMRHLLLDSDFNSKSTCSALLRECCLVSCIPRAGVICPRFHNSFV